MRAVTPRRLGVHLAAGTASSALAVLAAVVAMPLYLRYLGAEGFGVLGFIFALQTAVLALDAGLGVSVTRRVAQAQEEAAIREITSVVWGLSQAAWVIALAIGAAIALLAPALVKHWLNLAHLSHALATQAMIVAAAAVAFRWPIALYQGVLIGAQRVAAVGILNIVATLAGTAGAVALAAWTADLRWVVACLAASAFGQVMAARHLVLRTLGPSPAPARGSLRAFFRQAAAAGWLGVIGLLLMQVDKVVLSRLLPVDQFGYYVMASLMAGSLYALVTPVFNVTYPQLSHLAGGSRTALEQAYRRSSLMLAALVFPIAAAIGLFGGSILLMWTRDAAAARAGAPVVLMLAFGTALHGTMFLPYALKLSLGATRLALAIAAAVLVLSLPVMVFATLGWGATGAAAGWLGLHVLYVLAGSAVTHHRLLPGLEARWLAQDLGLPLLVSLAVVAAAALLASSRGWPALQQVVLAAVCVMACWALLAVASRRLRLGIRGLLAPAG